ncbi:succinate dehydrogenase [ubiquinone] iron-sulfur subunit, mitochondrial isoform X2 [Leptinotarsa decemlineata]|uniref:succinate dehydrogenase [ubiquinone] iron-sulfur subunit, mitochondrial isoform X2 n=1 Tax=Leptinotarsa decemlineata TaxID=7539 RepID=UPI003D306FD9
MFSAGSFMRRVCSDSKILRLRSLSSKVETDKKTKTDKKPKLKTFKIYRYNPQDKNKKPQMQLYTIDLNDCRPMVLDALNKIKTEQDSSISYRRSCREGICGSCGMNIDGVNRLACLHKIKPRGTTKIYPLPHMYVIKDLVVDFNKFLEQHRRIKPYLIRDELTDIGKEQLVQSVKDRDNLLSEKLELFADDTTLIYCRQDSQPIHHQMEADSKQIDISLNIHKITLYFEKSLFMFIDKKSCKATPSK